MSSRLLDLPAWFTQRCHTLPRFMRPDDEWNPDWLKRWWVGYFWDRFEPIEDEDV